MNKKFSCNVIIDDEHDIPKPVFPAKRIIKNIKDDEIIKDDMQSIENDITSILEEDRALSITPQQRQAQLSQLHLLMDRQLAKHQRTLNRHLSTKRMDDYFKLFSKCMEQAAIDYGHKKSEAKKYIG